MAIMKIDRTWPLSATEQLKSQLRLAIRTGNLRAGSVLPTVKTLAADLALNPNTIAAAYRDLVAEGLLTQHRRGGTRIAPGPFPHSAAERELLAMADRLIRLAQSRRYSGGEVLRLVAGRWAGTDASGFGADGRYPLYDFMQRHEHDQA